MAAPSFRTLTTAAEKPPASHRNLNYGLTPLKVISQRYERGSIVLTTNQAYKHWPKVFNNDSTLTSAVLDRLLHHAETFIIEGKSYRMKDQIEAP